MGVNEWEGRREEWWEGAGQPSAGGVSLQRRTEWTETKEGGRALRRLHGKVFSGSGVTDRGLHRRGVCALMLGVQTDGGRTSAVWRRGGDVTSDSPTTATAPRRCWRARLPLLVLPLSYAR